MQSSIISKVIVTGTIQEILAWIEMKIEYHKEQPCNFGFITEANCSRVTVKSIINFPFNTLSADLSRKAILRGRYSLKIH